MFADDVIPTSYARLVACLDRLATRFPALSIGSIGQSVLGRALLFARIGTGEKTVLIVGSHHGNESATASLLLRFLDRILIAAESGAHLCGGFDPAHLLRHRTVYLLPMPNPDGTDLALGGAETAAPLGARVLAMNGGNRNFAAWCANARGVDLCRNYSPDFEQKKKAALAQSVCGGCSVLYGGEFPESEPETAALYRFARFLFPRVSLSLRTAGERIDRSCHGQCAEGAELLASCFASVSGYRVATDADGESDDGFRDELIRELGLPAFTILCGSGQNEGSFGDLSESDEKIFPILLTAIAF